MAGWSVDNSVCSTTSSNSYITAPCQASKVWIEYTISLFQIRFHESVFYGILLRISPATFLLLKIQLKTARFELGPSHYQFNMLPTELSWLDATVKFDFGAPFELHYWVGITVGIWITNIWIMETSEKPTFTCPVFKWWSEYRTKFSPEFKWHLNYGPFGDRTIPD